MSAVELSPPNQNEILQVRNRQISAVHEISRELSATLDLDERLKHILAISMDAVDAVAGTIYLYRHADDKLVFRHVVGEKSRELTGLAISATEGVSGSVFQSGEALITNKPQETSGHRADVGESVGFHTSSIVTIPLKYQAGRPVGVMQVLNKRNGEFDDNDLEVLEIIASIAATAIQNAELARDAQLSAVAHAVGDLSHDIKNKVTPISLSVDTLWPLADEMYSDLDRISAELPIDKAGQVTDATGFLREFYPESFQIIKDQVQEVQDFTKLIADALKGIITEPALDPNELVPLIERQLDSLEPIARKADIQLVRELNRVPTFRFDRFLIERAVYNLVNNAIPETPRGGTITIRTDAVSGGQWPEGRCVVVEVRDTGRGMPPHVMERILKGDAKSTKPGGTGLGTRIVYNAVAAHHGIFDGDSREGSGTTFRIKLPLME